MTLGLAEAGAEVVICGRRSGPLKMTAQEVQALGADALVIPTDVTVEEELQALRARAGNVDILVNNAGTTGPTSKVWTEITLEEWQQVLALNLYAPFRLCQMFAPAMVEQQWGRIINIASLYGHLGSDPANYPGMIFQPSPYFVSKHGLNGLTHHLATLLAPHGVTVNSLSPGAFETELTREWITPALERRWVDGTPLRRFGTGKDLKAVVVFLASPGSQYITGQNLIADGGWTIW
jgi:gluconate 5-dehydrogenase